MLNDGAVMRNENTDREEIYAESKVRLHKQIFMCVFFFKFVSP